LFFDPLAQHPDPPSFPTRRSSDLGGEEGTSGSRNGLRQQRPNGWGERARPEHRVDDDLEGHGVQERDGTRQYTDAEQDGEVEPVDRKSTRLNSSHRTISYAVFCLK